MSRNQYISKIIKPTPFKFIRVVRSCHFCRPCVQVQKQKEAQSEMNHSRVAPSPPRTVHPIRAGHGFNEAQDKNVFRGAQNSKSYTSYDVENCP